MTNKTQKSDQIEQLTASAQRIGSVPKGLVRAEREKKMKCNTCEHKGGYTLGADECGAGHFFEYCSKGHWEGNDDGENGQIKDPWEDCSDYKPL